MSIIAERRVYRRGAWTRAVGAVLVGGGILWPIFVAATGATLAEVLTVCVAAVGLVALGVAQLRSRLELDAHNVRIVNLFRRRTLRRDDVDRAAVDRYRIFPTACVVRLNDGSNIGVWALPGINPVWKRHDEWLARVVDELNSGM